MRAQGLEGVWGPQQRSVGSGSGLGGGGGATLGGGVWGELVAWGLENICITKCIRKKNKLMSQGLPPPSRLLGLRLAARLVSAQAHLQEEAVASGARNERAGRLVRFLGGPPPHPCLWVCLCSFWRCCLFLLREAKRDPPHVCDPPMFVGVFVFFAVLCFFLLREAKRKPLHVYDPPKFVGSFKGCQKETISLGARVGQRSVLSHIRR